MNFILTLESVHISGSVDIFASRMWSIKEWITQVYLE